MVDSGLITTLLGVILTSIFSQTIAVWVALMNVKSSVKETKSALEEEIAESKSTLEKKITESKCPFGECPLYSRARLEAVETRDIPKS